MDSLLVAILPLVAFVILDIFTKPKISILVALALSVLLAIWYFVKIEQIDYLMLGEVFFLLVLGGVSIWMNKTVFFKYQPAVMGTVFTAIIFYFQFFYEPILLHYAPLMAKMMPEKMNIDLTNPGVLLILEKMSLNLGFVLLLHSLVMFFAAKKRNWIWLSARISIYPMLIGVAVLTLST